MGGFQTRGADRPDGGRALNHASPERRIYLDDNASAPLRPEAAEAMRRCESERFANPSSIHAEGRTARRVVEEAAESVARLIGADPSEILFTSGGTESNNLALEGFARREEAKGRLGRMVATAVEHASVLEPMRALEQRGWKISLLPVTTAGEIDLDAVDQALKERVALAACMSANNVTGVANPMGTLAQRFRAAGGRVHCDAVQSAGRQRINVDDWGVDFLALSSHKIGGPKGVGALYVRKGVAISPLITGGPQQRGLRGGTLNTAGISGFGAAARCAATELASEPARQQALMDRLLEKIRRRFEGVRIHGESSLRLPNTLNLYFPGAEGSSLVIGLDLEGVAVSAGAACDSGATEPSHVLTAMGCCPEEARSSIRISIGRTTEAEELDSFLLRLEKVVGRIRQVAP